MTIEEAKQFVSCFTYKQGWTIELVSTKPPYLYVQAPPTLDSDNPVEGGLARPWHKHYITLYGLTTDRLLEEVKESVYRLEYHEFTEWLRFKGEHVTPPQH